MGLWLETVIKIPYFGTSLIRIGGRYGCKVEVGRKVASASFGTQLPKAALLSFAEVVASPIRSLVGTVNI